jgi:secreted PhoX family phosphatase
MSRISRRGFLARSAAVTAGVSLAGPFEGFVAHAAAAGNPRTADGYGPLLPTADARDGAVRLDLPTGFNYRSFHPTGSLLGDGNTVPARPDGMAAFRGSRGNSILVRNHEINGPGAALGGAGAVYDPMTKGGTVTVEVDAHGNVVSGSDFVSLRGTQNNCAGGQTGWNTWLSCEETVNGDDVGNDFTGQSNVGLLKHGYVYEVPSDGTSSAVPIRSAGRFAHEAAVVTPSGDAVYLTEDNFAFASGFYRYLPPSRGRRRSEIADGGQLQMLKVVGVDNADLSLGQSAGASYDVEWVDIDDPDPTFAPGTTNDQAIVAVGDQGRAQGAAIFSRLEGAYYSGGNVYFISTQGGATASGDSAPFGFGDGRGQVWLYKPGADRLSLVFESPGSSTLDLPDNVVVSKHGSLVLCEDGSGDNFLRGLTRGGQVFDFARNADPSLAGQEFAGATFSHDGSTLFVNIQSSRPSYSIAIWGPWQEGPF